MWECFVTFWLIVLYLINSCAWYFYCIIFQFYPVLGFNGCLNLNVLVFLSSNLYLLLAELMFVLSLMIHDSSCLVYVLQCLFNCLFYLFNFILGAWVLILCTCLSSLSSVVYDCFVFLCTFIFVDGTVVNKFGGESLCLSFSLSNAFVG